MDNNLKIEPNKSEDGFPDNNQNDFAVTWIGHSTLLARIDGLNILTDPIFSKRCSPVTFAGPKRCIRPGINFEDLPDIDVVMISHTHYDHLDRPTIKTLGSKPLYIVPRGIGGFLKRLKIKKYIELRWWESIEINGVEFVCTPAKHFSIRSPINLKRALSCTFIVRGNKKNFFFAGDSAYSTVFKDIGERYGPFDLAAIPISPCSPGFIMKNFHVSPKQAIQMYLDLKAMKFLPIHWGCFKLGLEGVNAPSVVLIKEIKNSRLDSNNFWILNPGEVRVL